MSSFIEPIYVLENSLNSKLSKETTNNIYFVPNYKNNKAQIQAMNLTELKKHYRNPELLKKISDDDVIIPYNVELLTISELKHLLSSVINVPNEHILLFGKREYKDKRTQNEINNRKKLFNEVESEDVILGFSYRSEFGKREMSGDFLKEHRYSLNSLDMLHDESTYLVQNYPIKNNCIYFFTKEAIISLEKSEKITDQEMELILETYFPFKNPFKDETEYAIFKDEKDKLIKAQADTLVKKDGDYDKVPLRAELFDLPNMRFSNLVISTDTNKRNDIDVQSLFKEYKFDENVVFVRYEDQIKNNYFRVNNGVLFPNIGKYNISTINLKLSLKHLLIESSEISKEISKIKSKYPADMPIQSDDLRLLAEREKQKTIVDSDIQTYRNHIDRLSRKGAIDFNDITNYFVNYVDGKYKPIIDKKTLTNWKKPIFLEREEECKDRVKGIEQVEFKIAFYQSSFKKYMFFSVFITRYGEVYTKITDLSNNYTINKDDYQLIIDKSNKLIASLNSIIDGPKLCKINLAESTEIVTFNSINHFVLSEGDSYDEFKSRIMVNSECGFFIENNEYNFTYKFLRTNGGYSIKNAKKLFFLLKTSLGQADVSKLKAAWISEAARVFKLTKVESLNILETITEEVEQDDFKNSDMSNVIDIIFSKSDDANVIVVSIINLSSNNDLENVIEFIYSILNSKGKALKMLSHKESDSPMAAPALTTSPKASPPQVIIRTDIKTQVFVNDDNVDIDIDYSDSDDDSDEEDEDEAPKPASPSQKSPSPTAAAVAVVATAPASSKNTMETQKAKNNALVLKGDTTKQISTRGMPTNVREYMINMRKDKDPRLFIFKKTGMFDSYSSKCGAVDMRQPILASKMEVENMERNEFSRRALEKYRYKLLLWGSNKDTLNFYMCPRIWCIRDNCEITPLDFLNNNALCPICGGGVIDTKDKKIGTNKTILLRKGKSNNYWGDPNVPDDFLIDLPIYVKEVKPIINKIEELNKSSRITFKEKDIQIKALKLELKSLETKTTKEQIKSIDEYKKLWKTHLNGTEKIAYPSFLKNKTHPEDLCMPCCNANLKTLEEGVDAIPNYDRCLIHRINAYIEIAKDTNIDEFKNKLKPGFVVNDMETKERIPYSSTLELNDEVLFIHKGDVNKNLLIKVEYQGGVLARKFTNLQIEYMNGVTLELPEVNKRWVTYKKAINDSHSDKYTSDYFKIVQQKDDVQGEYTLQYILGKEKFPIGPNKHGVLVNKIEEILNPNNLNRVIKGNIDFERVEATDEMVSLFKKDKNNFIRTFGVPDYEYMANHKKKNKVVLEKGDLIKKNYKGFLRKGVNQNEKYSIFSVFQNIRTVKNIETFIKILVEILTPELFLSLNCGEVFKAFVPTEYDFNNEDYLTIFSKWIHAYDKFIKAEFPKFRGAYVVDIKNILSTPNKRNFELMNLYLIHLGHENYKRFICDLNIDKNYDYVIDLLCAPIPNDIYKKYIQQFDVNISEEQKMRLNPFLIEYVEKTDSVFITNPPFKDLTQCYDFEQNKSVLIYKCGKFYENIILGYKIDKNKLLEYYTIPTKQTEIMKRIYNLAFINELKDDYGYQMPQVKNIKILAEKTRKLSIKNLVIDRYYKGIGVIVKTSIGEFLMYTKPFKYNFDLSIPYIKYQYSLLPKPTLKNLVKLNMLISELGVKNIYNFTGVHTNKKNDILGVYTNNNLLILIEKEQYSKQFGLVKNSEGELSDIDFLLNTEVDIIDLRLMNVSYMEHKASLYNIFKYTLSQFMKKNNKTINQIKSQLEMVFANYAYPNHLRIGRIYDLLKPISEKIFSILEDKFNNNETSTYTCINIKSEHECKLVKGCKYEKGEVGICKNLISKSNMYVLLNYLINELMYFPVLRDKILSGTFVIKNEKTMSDLNDLIVDSSFEKQVDELFTKNELVYINKNYIDSFLESDITLGDSYVTQEIKAFESKKNVPLNSATVLSPSKNVLEPGLKVDEQVIPPTQIKQIEQLQSIVNVNNTELEQNKTSGPEKHYGSTIGWDGIDYSKDKSFKKLQAGDCEPNFKVWGDTNKVYKGCSFIDTTKSKFPDKITKKMGKICATSLSTSGPRKGSLKTYGICKNDTIASVKPLPQPLNVEKSKPKPSSELNQNKTPELNKPGKQSVAAPAPVALKERVNKSVLRDMDGDIVPDVYADASDITGNKLDLTQKKNAKVKPGKCIFPFKYRSSSYPIKTFPRGKIYGKEYEGQDKVMDFYDCVPFSRRLDKYGYKCPTSLKKNMTIDTYGLCKSNITVPKVQKEIAEKAKAEAEKAKGEKETEEAAKKIIKFKIKTKKATATTSRESNTKKKDIFAVNYVIVNGNKKKAKKDKSISGGKCVFPFKYKGKEYNDCFTTIDNDGLQRLCATSIKPSGTWEKLGYCLPEGVTPDEYDEQLKKLNQQGGVIKNIDAVNYRVDEDGNKKVYKSKKIVPGKCVFPFKHKRITYNDCADSDDKTFKYCATKVNKNGTMETYAFCPKQTIKYKYKTVVKNTTSSKQDPPKKRQMKISSKNWISKNFGEGFKINDSIVSDGNCFFDSLQVALELHGINVTIADLRMIIKKGVTRDNFLLYKELYENALILEDMEMVQETRFIEGIDTFEDFKEFVMTNNYWADMLSISLIERFLDAKIILFDERMFKYRGLSGAINCGNNLDKFTTTKCSICDVSIAINDKIKNGEIPDDEIKVYLDRHNVKYTERSNLIDLYKDISEREAHNFVDIPVGTEIKPNKFILMNYERGNHYKLVYYKDKAIFKKMSDLPLKAQEVIKNKCGKIKSYKYLF